MSASDDDHVSASDDDQRHLLRMEAILAAMLRYGAIVAGGWIVLGLAWGMLGAGAPSAGDAAAFSDRCLAIGTVLLIALPVLRVALMMIIFAFERDFRFAAISAAVLIIIAAGFALGALNMLP